MNKEEADIIVKVGLDFSIGVQLLNKAEVYDVIIDSDAQFTSFEAAKLAMKAFIVEKQFRHTGNEDFDLPDLFHEIKIAEETKENAADEQKTLKIVNKESLFNYPMILVFTSHKNVCKVKNNNFSHISQVIDYSDLDPGERPIYICGIKNYNGFLIVAFENGKVGKISMDSFKTEFNRRKLKNVYNDESKLVFIEHIEKDIDLVAISSIDKVVLFNTGQINPVGSKTTKGVQVMKSKDSSKMIKIKKLEQVTFEDPEYYRKGEGLNVVGFYLKEGDSY